MGDIMRNSGIKQIPGCFGVRKHPTQVRLNPADARATPKLDRGYKPVTCGACNGTGQMAGLGPCGFCKQSRGQKILTRGTADMRNRARAQVRARADQEKRNVDHAFAMYLKYKDM